MLEELCQAFGPHMRLQPEAHYYHQCQEKAAPLSLQGRKGGGVESN